MEGSCTIRTRWRATIEHLSNKEDKMSRSWPYSTEESTAGWRESSTLLLMRSSPLKPPVDSKAVMLMLWAFTHSLRQFRPLTAAYLKSLQQASAQVPPYVRKNSTNAKQNDLSYHTWFVIALIFVWASSTKHLFSHSFHLISFRICNRGLTLLIPRVRLGGALHSQTYTCRNSMTATDLICWL